MDSARVLEWWTEDGVRGIVGARRRFTKGETSVRRPTAFQSKVYATVRMIPRGCVASYGDVAGLVGHPRSARAVGGVLAHSPEGLDLPWWRVVNGQGAVSTPRIHHTAQIQRALLEDEGVAFSEGGRLDWERFGWDPDPRTVEETLEALRP